VLLPPGVVSLQIISRETTKTRKNVVSLPFSSREATLHGSGEAAGMEVEAAGRSLAAYPSIHPGKGRQL
jgi:hypothetical protein